MEESMNENMIDTLNRTKTLQPNEKELKVFELKYAGKTYPEIEKEEGIPIQTLKEWFRADGRLKEPYDSYVSEQNKMRREEAKKIIRQNINNAAKVLANSLLSENEKIRLQAAIELLNRELGRQPKQEENIDSPAEKVKRTLALIKESVSDNSPDVPQEAGEQPDGGAN